MDKSQVVDKLSVLFEDEDLDEVFDRLDLDPMEVLLLLWDMGKIDEESL